MYCSLRKVWGSMCWSDGGKQHEGQLPLPGTSLVELYPAHLQQQSGALNGMVRRVLEAAQ
jgi:hypothetical protein